MRVAYVDVVEVLERVLLGRGMHEERAALCARLFADASRDGVPSHGLNRFPGFVAAIDGGEVVGNAMPEKMAGFGGLERYDGHFGPGPANAWFAMGRACELAGEHGIGCVALARTNHWMRAGNYGWQAAERGCFALCFTNGTPVMAPHGAHVAKLGNNPLVIAAPRASGRHVVLDTAMSQYSWGRLKILRREGKQAPLPAGFTKDGELTSDPDAVLRGGATLAIGHWKGAGMALMFDVLAASLANGLASMHVANGAYDHGISQVFVAIDARKLGTNPEPIIDEILEDLRSTPPTHAGERVMHPGERALAARERSERLGVEVEEGIWNEVRRLDGAGRVNKQTGQR
ncbi:MAG TPA: 3-dehydro-L-gulonate 2-dehydrogenase [Phycisphaerae bacterium]|nr:3-dehydro-L-gulonate 2-dehydrogenase [Phycisphaerae bacterium]